MEAGRGAVRGSAGCRRSLCRRRLCGSDRRCLGSGGLIVHGVTVSLDSSWFRRSVRSRLRSAPRIAARRLYAGARFDSSRLGRPKGWRPIPPRPAATRRIRQTRPSGRMLISLMEESSSRLTLISFTRSRSVPFPWQVRLPEPRPRGRAARPIPGSRPPAIAASTRS